MGVIVAENFDALTPPAMPTGWLSSAGISTQTGTGTFNTSPNALRNTVDATMQIAYYNTSNDGNGGDAQTSFNVIPVSQNNVYCVAYALARMTVPATTQAGLTSYFFSVDTSTSFVDLGKIVAGTFTNFVTKTEVASFFAGYKFRIFLICIGTALTARVQRLNDLKWLDNTAAWKVPVQDYLTTTDASLAGVGKGGVGMQRAGPTELHYVDDFKFETAPAPVPAVRRVVSGGYL